MCIVYPPRAAGVLLVCLLFAEPLAAQPEIGAAEAALAAGRPWHATQLLRPILADQTRAQPAARILAARAAAAWGGWGEVDRVLAAGDWSGLEDEPEARTLQARAALARQGEAEAADHLRVALLRGGSDHRRGIGHALLARAFDRMDQRDSAAVHYRQAAARLPAVADWLHLRAAAVLADSAERSRLYQAVRLPAARARIPWTEAAALERLPDPRGAAARLDLLGAPVRAARLRLAIAETPAERGAVRAALVALLSPRTGAADTREVIALLDTEFAPLGADVELQVARRAAAIGERERAVRGFTAARRAGSLRDPDRLLWGTALAQLGRHAEAVTVLAAVQEGPVAAAAAYQRARALLSRSGSAAALPALQEIPARWPDDSASAAVALYLAGDLLADRGDWEAARASFLQVARDYPGTAYAARGWLEAGTIAYARGDRAGALDAFGEAAARFPDREEGSAGAYWAGRIEAQRGDTGAAHQRWRQLMARVPHSYYALAAARRLGEPAWLPQGSQAPFLVGSPLREALARVTLLDQIGFAPEVRYELERIDAEAGQAPDALVEAAQALHDHGHVARGLALAQRAFARGAERTPALYRLLYPWPQEAVFRDVTTARGLDPAFVAGLIRQESAFDPRARSAADARGLMQVLPTVGRQLATQLGWTGWDGVLLYQPEVSLTLGGMHLAAMIRRYADPVRVLAAYNAGGTRVQRWDTRPGVAEDPELFLEMIPYLETRNYVRRVLRNAEFYRGLYGNEGVGAGNQGLGPGAQR